jgi:hypothetical protein
MSNYTYQALVDFGKCSALNVSDTVTVLGKPLFEHACADKCRTCKGPECYCEEPDETALCLPEDLCRQACDAEPDCAGYSVRWDGTPHCVLCAPSPAPAPAPLAEWVVLEKVPGAACTDADDFKPTASTLTISKALAAIDINYVVPPKKDVAIEVLIRPEFAPDPRAMRLSVIPEEQPCGRSAPAAGVYAKGIASFAAFTELAPQFPFSDDPMDRIPFNMPRVYRVRENRYCGHANMRLTTPKFLAPFKCFGQCKGPCPLLGGCTCNGYYSGFDSEISNSLCVPETLCRQLCDATPGCDSYEMHRELDRCFLNIEQNCGDYHEDGLKAHPLYDLWIARHDKNQEAVSPYAHIEDHTYSLDYESLAAFDVTRLVFKGLEFSAGGTYKVCFCDLPPCVSVPDFRITLGTVHASGVSAILQQPRLRTVEACLPLPPMGDADDEDPGYRCMR